MVRKYGVLRAAMVLSLPYISVRETTETHAHEISQCTVVIQPISTDDEMLEYACPKWCTDDEKKHGLRRGNGSLKQGDLRVGRLFVIVRLQTIQGYVNMFRASCTTLFFTERIACPLHSFFLNRIYSDC